jgi:hypothetical protein
LGSLLIAIKEHVKRSSEGERKAAGIEVNLYTLASGFETVKFNSCLLRTSSVEEISTLYQK